MNTKNVGMSIHIPFCKHKCKYCDFKSYAGKEDKINEYITIFYPNYKKELKSEYRLYILSGALYNVGKAWINKGLKEDSATISKIFVDKLYPKEKNL